MPDATPHSTPEARTPEASAAASHAQHAPVQQHSTFVAVFVISALTIAFFLAVFFAFTGFKDSEAKQAQADSVRATLRAQDSLHAVALGRYNAVRDTAGAVQGYTMPIDSVMDAMATGADSAATTMPLRGDR